MGRGCRSTEERFEQESRRDARRDQLLPTTNNVHQQFHINKGNNNNTFPNILLSQTSILFQSCHCSYDIIAQHLPYSLLRLLVNKIILEHIHSPIFNHSTGNSKVGSLFDENITKRFILLSLNGSVFLEH